MCKVNGCRFETRCKAMYFGIPANAFTIWGWRGCLSQKVYGGCAVAAQLERTPKGRKPTVKSLKEMQSEKK